ncbi:hypothetical protein GCM10009578_037400 [Streptomyces rhizosphaericus]
MSAGPAHAPETVYVGLATDPVEHNVARLTVELAFGLPVLAALIAAAGWHITGRALGPVERLRGQAAEITATDLHRRLDLPSRTDEIQRLGTTLSDLLARLDEATARQRQFVAEAAHELRSLRWPPCGRKSRPPPGIPAPTSRPGCAHSRPGVAVACARVRPARVRGDPDALSRAIRNLLDNAVRYAHHHVSLSSSCVHFLCLLCGVACGGGC